MIPSTVFTTFGLNPDLPSDFTIAHALCISSWRRLGFADPPLVLVEREPDSKWWNALKNSNCIRVQKVTAPTSVDGVPMHHPAHRGDYIRLSRLLTHGGIYLDSDVVVLRPFDDLLDHTCVMGCQRGRGLCNAVILARPDHPFIEYWLHAYDSLWHLHSNDWDYMSVVWPGIMAPQFPVHILPDTAFFWPNCTEIDKFFEHDIQPATDAYAVHLWHTKLKNIHHWPADYFDILRGRIEEINPAEQLEAAAEEAETTRETASERLARLVREHLAAHPYAFTPADEQADDASHVVASTTNQVMFDGRLFNVTSNEAHSIGSGGPASRVVIARGEPIEGPQMISEDDPTIPDSLLENQEPMPRIIGRDPEGRLWISYTQNPDEFTGEAAQPPAPPPQPPAQS